jgi:hypothetical protein
MARVSFTVDYTQGATGPGQITFTLNGVPTSVTASGRLDAVGNRVVSPEIPVLGNRTVQVECVRTSSDAMRVVVVFLLSATSSYSVAPPMERVIENVPLSFTS